MNKYYITAIRYNKEKTRIEYVRVNYRDLESKTVSGWMVSSRVFVANLIATKAASFMTATRDAKDGSYTAAADVHLVGGEFISTDANDTTKDNLSSLPTF